MAKKIKRDLIKEIEIAEGIEATVEGNLITMKKDSNEVKRMIPFGVEVSKEGNKIVLTSIKAGRVKKRNFGTSVGHVKNLVKGLVEGFEYEMEICNVHFPMTVNYDKNINEFTINNLLGEKTPRKTKLSDKVELDIQAPKIIIRCYDIELAGQTASKIEFLSRVRNRDRNKFQDGIFITKKPGMIYLE